MIKFVARVSAHIAALIAIATLAACTDPVATSRSSLEAMGFTNITIDKNFGDFMSCSDSDAWARSFTATGVNGMPVRGTVCGGYLAKGATVRFG